jgi:hypothetical protein
VAFFVFFGADISIITIMSDDPDGKMSLDDFKRWKVPELKTFLRNRGLKLSGTKEELTALRMVPNNVQFL